jgi:hypothetical protein
MPLKDYPVICVAAGCSHKAVYKIASHWSDGITSELKTYSLCCNDCLQSQFQLSMTKQAKCRLAPGETLAMPGIYQLSHGRRDHTLVRLGSLEQKLQAKGIV